MCNLYSHTSNRQAILDFTKAMAVAETVGNLEPQRRSCAILVACGN